jgi:hypothetical protein
MLEGPGGSRGSAQAGGLPLGARAGQAIWSLPGGEPVWLDHCSGRWRESAVTGGNASQPVTGIGPGRWRRPRR